MCRQPVIILNEFTRPFLTNFLLYFFDFVMLLHQCKCWPCERMNELISLLSKYVEIFQWKLNRSIKSLRLTSEWSFREKLQLKYKLSIRCLQMYYTVRFEFRFVIDMNVQDISWAQMKCLRRFVTRTHILLLWSIQISNEKLILFMRKSIRTGFAIIQLMELELVFEKKNSLLSQWSTLLCTDRVSCVVFDSSSSIIIICSISGMLIARRYIYSNGPQTEHDLDAK